MNRLLLASLVAGCVAFAPIALAKEPDGDVPGGFIENGKGNQGCWTIPIYDPGDPNYKNPGDMFQNEKFGRGKGDRADQNKDKNPKELADEYPEYFANVGDMIDQQCRIDSVTKS